MEKKDIAAFFDGCAGWWDADMIRSDSIINQKKDEPFSLMVIGDFKRGKSTIINSILKLKFCRLDTIL